MQKYSYIKKHAACCNKFKREIRNTWETINDMDEFNPLSTNASNYVDIINEYDMFSRFNFNGYVFEMD